MSETMKGRYRRLQVMVLAALLLWLMVVGGSLGWNLYLQEQKLIAQAKRAAQVTLNKDVGFRQWVRSHGGVYVPVTEQTPPNPWLSHAPHRDVTIGSRPFTLINSSYATRQMMEQVGKAQGVSSRVTSLKPLRPQNAPDRWEEQALKRYAAHSKKEDYFELLGDSGERGLLRGMRPFYIEQGCLACHGHQGYAIGDLRGAMSVSVDLKAFGRDEPSMVPTLLAGHGAIALLGLVGLWGLFRYGRASLIDRQKLWQLSCDLERRVESEVAARRDQEALLIQQSKMAAMGEMIGAIAHQWRQPLNALGITIQDIQDAHQYGELDTPYLQRAVEHSMQQIAHMSHTIDDFRNFFRPDDAQEQFEVQAAVRHVLELLGAQFKRHNITVSTLLPDEPLRVQAAANPFKQALLNILTNAKDAIEERAVASGQVAITLSLKEHQAVLEICDNAGGLEPEAQKRLFEPYFTTKDHDHGTGIGLYMARMIIEDVMGGTLSAHNNKAGACFVIALATVSPD